MASNEIDITGSRCHTTENLKKQLQESQIELQKLQKKYDKLINSLQECKNTGEKMTAQTEKYSFELSSGQSSQNEEDKDWKKEATRWRTCAMKLNENLKSVTDQYDIIKKPIEEKTLRKATVKIYSRVKHPLVNQILLELTDELQKFLLSNGVALTFDDISETGGLEGSQPLLVICVNASRLGTDVDTALKHVTCKKESMVVILHHKDIHALPSQPSEKLLIEPAYKTLAGFTDMACTSEKGLYDCEMNDRAIKRIADFIIQRNQHQFI